MAIRDAFLPEFDHEMGTTRKTLERVPENNTDWKPHDKSMTMGRLAGHLGAERVVLLRTLRQALGDRSGRRGINLRAGARSTGANRHSRVQRDVSAAAIAV